MPLTIPRRLQDNPTYFNFRSESGRVLYGEDVYVGYRYYEKVDTKPLFPFGHGLSYSTFELGNLHAQAGDITEITLQVTNTGSRAGAEVVQIYVEPPLTCFVERPVKELKAFRKVYLRPQETKQIAVNLDTVSATSYWNESRDKWCSEAGEYKLLVGTSSAVTPLVMKFTVGKTKYWKGRSPCIEE